MLVVRAALTAMGADDPSGWAMPLSEACRWNGIRSPRCLASFLGNICHETGGLRHLEESFDYTPARLRQLFSRSGRITVALADELGRKPGERVVPQERQQAIANWIYGGAWGLRNLGNTRPNDGWYFRGKGLIQLTGRANHTRFAKQIGVDVVALQKLLDTRDGAANSAAQFWHDAGCAPIAEASDHEGVRRRINGGTLGLEEVTDLTEKALAAILREQTTGP
jgi:putative chitinase